MIKAIRHGISGFRKIDWPGLREWAQLTAFSVVLITAAGAALLAADWGLSEAALAFLGA